MQLKITLDVPAGADAATVIGDLLILTAASARLRTAIANPAAEFAGTGIIRDPATNDIAGMWELAPQERTGD